MDVPQPAPPDRTFGEVIVSHPSRSLWRGANKPPVPNLDGFGPLKHLVGKWTAEGTGWNMIALPFNDAPAPPGGFKYRILMNQYNEKLDFLFADDKVKNRGLKRPGEGPVFDQEVAALDYQQLIRQTKAEDFPPSPVAGGLDLPIHHEPGLWLYEKNRRSRDDEFSPDQDVQSEVVLKVARLASIPHGNSVLAIGTAEVFKGMPKIPPISGLPSGRFEDVTTHDYDFRDVANPDPYLAPYKHYIDNPFKGNNGSVPGFPGFSPADMNAILRFQNTGVKIARTTVLTVDTTRKSGGINNLPFTVREAEPVSMKSTFWIQELEEKDAQGNPKLRLQYSQVVMLNFFRPRQDEFPERAVWPHISICTLTKTLEPESYEITAA
jgi:hypothetical protein